MQGRLPRTGNLEIWTESTFPFSPILKRQIRKSDGRRDMERSQRLMEVYMSAHR